MHRLERDKIIKFDGSVVDKLESIVKMINHQTKTGQIAAMLGNISLGFVKHMAKNRSGQYVLSIQSGDETLSISFKEYQALPDLPPVIDRQDFFNSYVPEEMQYRSICKATGAESFTSPIVLVRTPPISYPIGVDMELI